jgi:hypothetical protein
MVQATRGSPPRRDGSAGHRPGRDGSKGVFFLFYRANLAGINELPGFSLTHFVLMGTRSILSSNPYFFQNSMSELPR